MPTPSVIGFAASEKMGHLVWLLSRQEVPPILAQEEQEELRTAVLSSPAAVGITLANWNWKGVWHFCKKRLGKKICRSSCYNYLHRLGFALKRPKKRLLKASPEKRERFVREYAQLCVDAAARRAKIFFADEAHFRADVYLRAKWTPRGEPALANSTSPRLGEKVSYYSAICLETGETEAMAVPKNCNADTSVDFLKQIRANHSEPLIVIWDNSSVHRGPEMRQYLTTPNLRLQLVALPAYSPDFNADEAIWDWAREEATANICFGTAQRVRETMDAFFAGLTKRTAEAKSRCRTILQARTDPLLLASASSLAPTRHVDLILESV